MGDLVAIFSVISPVHLPKLFVSSKIKSYLSLYYVTTFSQVSFMPILWESTAAMENDWETWNLSKFCC